MESKLEAVPAVDVPVVEAKAADAPQRTTTHRESTTSGGASAKFMGNHASFFFSRHSVTDRTRDSDEDEPGCCSWMCRN